VIHNLNIPTDYPEFRDMHSVWLGGGSYTDLLDVPQHTSVRDLGFGIIISYSDMQLVIQTFRAFMVYDCLFSRKIWKYPRSVIREFWLISDVKGYSVKRYVVKRYAVKSYADVLHILT